MKYCYLMERLNVEKEELENCFWIEDGRSDFINITDDLMIKGRLSTEDVLSECADVANFCMMLFHVIKERE